MAKKKTETASETPKKATASKKAAKPAASTGNQLVDTNLAAQNAAKQLVAGLKKPAAGGSGTAPSSKMFQQLKAGQTNSSIMGGVLDKNSASHGKSNSPFHAKNQKGHNQTFGADASKSLVPRRTSGG